MPTVHVVKQYMIDPLTQTLYIQSKQRCESCIEIKTGLLTRYC